MKKILSLLLAIGVFFGIEQLTRLKTHGLRLPKTHFDCVEAASGQNRDVEITDRALDQPFYFLGSGAQFYAFASQDGTLVLKLFKHYHVGLPSRHLKALSLPGFLEGWRDNVLARRYARMEKIFKSAELAYEELKEQTGLLHLRLLPGNKTYPQITLYDNIGIAHQFDLNKAPFALQKRADLLFPYLTSHPERTSTITDSLKDCIDTRTTKGIANTDPLLHLNFGVVNGKVVEIDIGSFAREEVDPETVIDEQTLALKQWISKHP